MANKIQMRDYLPKEGDIIMFDTNIMIDIFYPMNLSKDVSDEVHLYESILKSKASIIISAVQISEFINRCIRFQFGLYKNEHSECKDYKSDYRGCEDYRTCMGAIMDIIENEWKGKLKFINDKFEELPFDKIFLNNFAYDFNDALIVEIANAYNAMIVTNDADIISYSVNNHIITNNPFILKFR